MIVTVTPNPSIDRTASLPSPLTRGAVHRVTSVTDQAGGKGVNVARALTLAGLDALAVLLVLVHRRRPWRRGDPGRVGVRGWFDACADPAVARIALVVLLQATQWAVVLPQYLFILAHGVHQPVGQSTGGEQPHPVRRVRRGPALHGGGGVSGHGAILTQEVRALVGGVRASVAGGGPDHGATPAAGSLG